MRTFRTLALSTLLVMGCADTVDDAPTPAADATVADDAGTDTLADVMGPGEDTVTADIAPSDSAEPDSVEPDVGPDDIAAPDVPSDVGADTADAGPVDPPGQLVVERWGGRVWGPMVDMSLLGRELWFGTSGVVEPGHPDAPIRAQLGRLRVDSGDLRLFEDELPTIGYPGAPGQFTEGPVPTASVALDTDRVLALAINGLLSVAGDVITLHPLTAGDAPAVPTALVVDRFDGRDRVWVSTDQGLLRLQADTLAVETVYSGEALGGTEPGRLALDPATGAVFVVVYDGEAQTSAVVRVLDDQILTLTPGADGVPEGTVQDVAFSAERGKAYISIAAWDTTQGGIATWDGVTSETLVVEAQLGEAATGTPATFGPGRLSLSDQDDLLVVGGMLLSSPAGGIKGGGIAWVHLDTGHLAGLHSGNTDLPGQHVSALAYDPLTKRTFTSLRRICSENKLGNEGLIAISFDADGSPRFERPILSGVRTLAERDGKLLAGLRDDHPGLSCDGYSVQHGVVAVHSNRSGELIPLKPAIGGISTFSGPTAMDIQGGKVALATRKDGFLFGNDFQGGEAQNQAINYDVSLLLTDVAWAPEGDLWIAGLTSHQPGDPPVLADKGPRGAARLTFVGDKVEGFTHYVRASDDPADVTGLPTSEVTDVLVGDDGVTWLACGVERTHPSALERVDGDPFLVDGEPREGGVARIEPDGSVTPLITSDDAPDPRALAQDVDGSLVLLDAQNGALRYAGGTVEPATLPWSLPEDALGHHLWLGEAGAAASMSAGAWVALDGDLATVTDAGHAWFAMLRAQGLMHVGTDEGLLRVRTQAAADVVEADPAEGLLPPFMQIDPPDTGGGGECLEAGQVCSVIDDTCCPGLQCIFAGFAPNCL